MSTVSFEWPKTITTIDGITYDYVGESRDLPRAKHYFCRAHNLAGAFAPVHVENLSSDYSGNIVAHGSWASYSVLIKRPLRWVKKRMVVLAGPLELNPYAVKFLVTDGCVPLTVTPVPHRVVGTVVKVLNLDTAFAKNGSGPDAYVASSEFAEKFQGLRVGDRLSWELEPGSTRAKRIKYAH
jgi:hypothetical protein